MIEHPYGAHIFMPSLFFINPDVCLENSVRTKWAQKCQQRLYMRPLLYVFLMLIKQQNTALT